MLKARTKYLITISALAPAAILLNLLDNDAANTPEALRRMGDNVVWVSVGPNVFYKVMICVGCIAFLFAIVSTVLDVRRSRS